MNQGPFSVRSMGIGSKHDLFSIVGIPRLSSIHRGFVGVNRENTEKNEE